MPWFIRGIFFAIIRLRDYFKYGHMTKNKIALVLGAGAASGLAHIGVLKVLEKKGIKPDIISGTSVGALFGSLYALGMSAAEIEDIALSFDRKKFLKDVLEMGNPKYSLLGNKKIKKQIEKMVGRKTFADLKIPMKIIAADLATGQRHIFEKGRLSTAILASISIPGVFPTVKIGRRYFIDGTVVDPTPVEVVQKSAKTIIVVDLVMKEKVKNIKTDIISVLMRSYQIIRNQTVRNGFSDMKDKDVFVIRPAHTELLDKVNFTEIANFINGGEKAAGRVLGGLY